MSQLFDDSDGWATVVYNGVPFPQYEAHPCGLVRRSPSFGRTGPGGGTPGKPLKPNPIGIRRYQAVQLFNDRVRTSALVHRVVASTFMEDYRAEWEVHHIDHDPSNNALDNLYCCPDWLHDKIHDELARIGKTIIASVMRLAREKQ